MVVDNMQHGYNIMKLQNICRIAICYLMRTFEEKFQKTNYPYPYIKLMGSGSKHALDFNDAANF